jgi:ribonuclease Z
VLDVPSIDHIPSAVASFNDSPFFKRLRSQEEKDTKEYLVRTVYHLLGPNVLEDERYLAFMRGFPPNAQVRAPL